MSDKYPSISDTTHNFSLNNSNLMTSGTWEVFTRLLKKKKKRGKRQRHFYFEGTTAFYLKKINFICFYHCLGESCVGVNFSFPPSLTHQSLGNQSAEYLTFALLDLPSLTLSPFSLLLPALWIWPLCTVTVKFLTL